MHIQEIVVILHPQTLKNKYAMMVVGIIDLNVLQFMNKPISSLLFSEQLDIQVTAGSMLWLRIQQAQPPPLEYHHTDTMFLIECCQFFNYIHLHGISFLLLANLTNPI